MANTYTLIASSTVGAGGAANIEFASIPQTYTDLLLFASLRTANASAHDTVRIQFNSTTTNFTGKTIEGDGSTVASGSRTDGYLGFMNANTSTASVFSSAQLYIPNYTSSNNKGFTVDKVSEQNATTAYAEFVAGLWSNTAAITNIKLVPASSTNLTQYSSAYLYGISNS